jgi:hypothetical protein
LAGSALLLTGILLCGAVIGSPGVARAQDRAGVAGPASGESETRMRARDMRLNRALLETLERRRVAIDAKPGAPAATGSAIAFLDSRIKLLRSRIEKDIDYFRRAS